MKRVLGLTLVFILLLSGLAWAETLSVRGQKVNFREGPSVNNPIVFSASRYYPVKVVGRKGGWLQVVDFENDKAWVLGRLLNNTKAVVVKVKTANLRERPSTKSKILFTASRGAAFKVVKKDGEWLLVQHADGDKGWIHSNLTWGR